MAQYLGIRIVDSQTVEKVFHRLLLFGSAGVGRVAVLVKTSLITDADALEASCLVAGFQLLYREILVDSCGTAMYYNQVDFSWIFHCFLVIND